MRAWIAAVVLASAVVAGAQSIVCARRTATITVLDRHGEPIPGVNISDLRASAGPGASVAGFEAIGGSAHAVLLVDASESMNLGSHQGRQARAAELAFAAVAPAEKMALIIFGDTERREAGFGAPPAVLRGLIEQALFVGGTALYDAIVVAARAVRNTGPGGSVVVVSDGDDDASRYTAGLAAAAAVAAGVRVFLISPAATIAERFALEARDPAALDAEDGINRLTQGTGGLDLAARHPYAPTARRLWAVIENGYTLRIRLPRPRSKPVHWKLRLTPGFRREHRGARLLYPNPLAACGTAEAHSAGAAAPTE